MSRQLLLFVGFVLILSQASAAEYSPEDLFVISLTTGEIGELHARERNAANEARETERLQMYAAHRAELRALDMSHVEARMNGTADSASYIQKRNEIQARQEAEANEAYLKFTKATNERTVRFSRHWDIRNQYHHDLDLRRRQEFLARHEAWRTHPVVPITPEEARARIQASADHFAMKWNRVGEPTTASASETLDAKIAAANLSCGEALQSSAPAATN